MTDGAARPPRPVVIRLRYRAEARPRAFALVLSLLGHVAVIGLFVLFAKPRPRALPKYAPVKLVSMAPDAKRGAKPRKSQPPPRRTPPPRPARPPEVTPPPREQVVIPPTPMPPPAPAPAPRAVGPRAEKPQPKPAARPSVARPSPPAPVTAPPVAEPPAVEVPVSEPAPLEATMAGVTVSADDLGFSDDGYLQRLVAKVSSRWTKPRSGLPSRSAVIVFVMDRTGRVVDLSLEESSGVPFFDRAAQRAIELASPLPPLPAIHRSETLKVHFEFIP